jgi:hypothetical protein
MLPVIIAGHAGRLQYHFRHRKRVNVKFLGVEVFKEYAVFCTYVFCFLKNVKQHGGLAKSVIKFCFDFCN